VQWVAVPKILYENNVHKQMVKQIETDLHARFISGINFKTQGIDFVGKLYQLKVRKVFATASFRREQSMGKGSY
jgi:hypothetical protein